MNRYVPLRGDRTLRSVQPAHQCLSVEGPVTTDRTRPVAFFPYWMLTVLDRTLDPQGPVNIDRTRPVTL